MRARTLVLASALALALPAAANAQRAGGGPQNLPRSQSQNDPAYRSGYERGVRNGEEDGRRNQRFDFQGTSDYRSGDFGYRRDDGDRNRWVIDFRIGFEAGYRNGFGRFGRYDDRDRYNDRYGNGGYNNGRYGGGAPPWVEGRGSRQRDDVAFRNGFTDGYEAGVQDGRGNRRFDPVGEGRYRSGDHGYNGRYGPREFYKNRYRDAFREGYTQGWNDGRRYDSRNYSDGRPWWWPW